MTFSDMNVEIIRKKIKNMYLTVLPPDGRLRISAPKSIKDGQIEAFLLSKRSWIEKQQKKFESSHQLSDFSYQSGEIHYLLGQKIVLDVFSTTSRPSVERTGGRLLLSVPEEYSTEERSTLLDRWYRQQLKELLPPLVEQWETIMGVHANEVRIKRMRTKWGTCNVVAKRVWINLQLLHTPLECIEYVVVHELVHLLEKSHNKRFYSLMSHYLPNWKERKMLLNSFMIR